MNARTAAFRTWLRAVLAEATTPTETTGRNTPAGQEAPVPGQTRPSDSARVG